jgi:hypothetical protein
MSPERQPLPPASRAAAVALILPVAGAVGAVWFGDWRWAVGGLGAGLGALLVIAAAGRPR